MDILDQSEVDSLLQSAADSGDDLDAPIAADASATPPPPKRDYQLPDHLKLTADRAQQKRISPVQVPVIVRLAERKMSVDKILDLCVGTIIEFEKPADSELDLVVNNIAVGTGNAVKCGEKFGLRIIAIEPWTLRIIGRGLYR